MRNLIFCFFTLLLSATLLGQADISATVVDTTGTTLPGANAILLRSSDTLLTSFGTTDNKGEFLMENVPIGDYTLRVSFLGFERPDQPITITESDQYLGLGDLTMYPSGYLLNNVEVTADRIPIRMKGDTMLYDADAFAVGENASVEDLLRRLPGMSIDANGQITWRGKPVQEVMINGKPFFAGNSTLITQNLDAKALKNVEVYDQKTDSEEITGVDDGEENTTVNLEMKEEFKAKIFGELYAGPGDKERYDGGAKLFRISDAQQIGILGTINNVNRVGFTGDEMMNFNRSSGRGSFFSTGGTGTLPYYDGGQTPGQNRSIAAGVNFGRSVGKDGQLTLDYVLFDRQQQQIVQQSEAFTRAGNEREVFSNETTADDNYSHRIGFEFRQKLDTTSRLTIEGSGYVSGNNSNSLAQTQVKSADGQDSDYSVDQVTDRETPGGDLSLDYNRRLGSKKGRTFSAEFRGSYRENLSDQQILTEGLQEESTLVGSLINGLQFQDRTTNSLGLSGDVEYNEPLGEKWTIELTGEYGFDQDEGDYRFRLGEEETVNILTRNFTNYRGGAEMVRRWGKGNNLQFGALYSSNLLELSDDVERSDRFNYILPRFRLRLRTDKGFYNFSYRANVSAPSVSQLQTIANPTTTGRVTIGNPDLDPSVRHDLNTYFWFNDQFRAISANVGLYGGYVDNAFGNSLTFTQGQQIYQTINVSHQWNYNIYSGATIGMDFISGELRLEANGGGSRGQGFVDDVARTNITTNIKLGGNITTEFNEQSFLKVGYTYLRNSNSFDDEESVDITTVTHDLLSQFELELSEKWRLETRLLYRFFDEAGFAGAADIPDLRASLEIRPFKKAGHYFLLGVFDLLDQNTVISRQAQAFRTAETISDGLGRYFLATFHYKI